MNLSFCESTMEIRAVLFDLDGVLVLTEQLKAEAHAETIKMLGGAQVPWILEKTNLVQFFDALVSSDDVDGKKPSPDPYLRALKLLSAHPSSSVVFEDSEAGIKSAVSAGAKVIAVRHSLNKRHDFSIANAVIHSFMDRNAVLQQIQSLICSDAS